MQSFHHYTRHPTAIADAERALLAWRCEAMRLKRRMDYGMGATVALEIAEQEAMAAHDFLAPPHIMAESGTLDSAVKLLLQSQHRADVLERCLSGNGPAAKTARLLIWHAPGSARMLAGDRARRLRLNAGTPAGAAALQAAIAYGQDLMAEAARATSPR